MDGELNPAAARIGRAKAAGSCSGVISGLPGQAGADPCGDDDDQVSVGGGLPDSTSYRSRNNRCHGRPPPPDSADCHRAPLRLRQELAASARIPAVQRPGASRPHADLRLNRLGLVRATESACARQAVRPLADEFLQQRRSCKRRQRWCCDIMFHCKVFCNIVRVSKGFLKHYLCCKKKVRTFSF